MSLDAFVSHSKPPPSPLATSSEIHDRGSVFQSYIYSCTSSSQAEKLRAYVGSVVHKKNSATHEMCAWRCMALKKGRSGLGEGGDEDFEVNGGSKNDGEDGGGKRILETMKDEGVLDAVVVVSRWYGGTMLGPVRFTHIENCTREVCRKFKFIDEVRDRVSALRILDTQLADLRFELASLTPPSSQITSQSTTEPPSHSEKESTMDSAEERLNPDTRKRKREDDMDGRTERSKPPPDYEKMLLYPEPDVEKAKRLVKARQTAVQSVTSILARKKESLKTDE